MKMYRVSIWSNNILRYNILKKTLKTVNFVNGNNDYTTKELIESKETAWFESLEEAVEWKKQKILFDIDFYQQKVDYKKRKLNDFIESLKLN